MYVNLPFASPQNKKRQSHYNYNYMKGATYWGYLITHYYYVMGATYGGYLIAYFNYMMGATW